MPSIFDYKHFFDDYCKECSLDLHLSFDMPSDYETACGTFDPANKTVFINAEHLNAKPDYEKAFFLFHELRHASQYLCPEHFGSEIHRSLQYVIGYDGTCYKLVNGHSPANWMAMKIILPTYILVSRTKSMPIHLLTNKSNSSMEILKS